MLPNTFHELLNTFKSLKGTGEVSVEFKKLIDNLEGYAESGMRSWITNVALQNNIIIVSFSYVAYEKHNQPYESSNWFNKYGNPILTARQANMYNVVENYYFELADNPNDYFTHINTNTQSKLQDKFNATRFPEETYVAWLERQVIAALGD